MATIDKNKYLPVDKNKLIIALKARKKTMSDFSREIGRGSSYIRDMIGRYNSISKSVVLLLKSELGINYEEYKPDENENKSERNEQTEIKKDVIKGDTFVDFMAIMQQSILRRTESLEDEARALDEKNKMDGTNSMIYAMLKVLRWLFQCFEITETEEK